MDHFRKCKEYLRNCKCVRGPRGPRVIKGDAGSPGHHPSFGFGICNTINTESGYVKFAMPGPLQDVEWMPSGLKVLKSEIYQISYKVVLDNESIKL